jgi:phosphatidylserine/phosphatidylglycerophosphate/cardiolipin synthase-like enzyme
VNSYPETIEYLLSNNISVKLDPKAGITTHAKVAVVDDLYVFIRSHNWTESALMYNNEVFVLITSKEIAQDALNYINSLWNQGRVLR